MKPSWQDGNPTNHAPSAQRVYRLAPGGAAPVSVRAGVDAAPVRRQAAKDSREHLAHALAIVDARIAFQRAIRDRQIQHAPDSAELLAFRGEAAIRHSYEYREEGAVGREAAWHREIFKPDALAVLRRGRGMGGMSGGDPDPRTFHLFFEIDLSSVAAAEIRHKLRIAARYRREPGLFARRYASAGENGSPADAAGCFHLILTTSAVRAANLAAIAAEERIESVRVATLAAFLGREDRSENDAAPASGPLSPIWHVPGRDRLARLPIFDEERKENP